MCILKIIKERKSVRRYKPDPIPDPVLLRVLDAARFSPSGKNLQPWKFILVRDKKIKKDLVEASVGQSFIAEAPIVVVACGFPDKCYSRMGNYMKSWAVDVAIAVEHMMLQAQEEGLGTCWIGAFEEKDVRRILKIPDDVKVLALTPLGYPDEIPRSRERKSLEEIIAHDFYE